MKRKALLLVALLALLLSLIPAMVRAVEGTHWTATENDQYCFPPDGTPCRSPGAEDM